MNWVETYGNMYVMGLGGLFFAVIFCLLALAVLGRFQKSSRKRQGILYWWPMWWIGMGLFMGVPWLTFIINQWGASLLIDSILSIGLWLSLGGVMWRFPWKEKAQDPVYKWLGSKTTLLHRGGLVLVGFFLLTVGYLIII